MLDLDHYSNRNQVQEKGENLRVVMFHVFLNTSYLIRYVDTHIEQSLCSQYNEQHIGPARFASLNVTATCVVEMVVMVTSGHENTARPHG